MVSSKPISRTICEVLREIGDLVGVSAGIAIDCEGNVPKILDNYDAIVFRLGEATQMAKSMDRRLRKYKKDYDEEMWEKKEIGK